ncbi:hypothetical protein [Marinobacter sp. SS21]|uniref:hypothetical protein n=1 Tax=Marinobacter sp. SS21 TaxID=2979460 RepID=UPI00232DCF8D|nr:hypothetical protein [Marinobacter sp. SS21]MDC0663550.1 hypothetical protein [Marinobacter sp. SS21]
MAATECIVEEIAFHDALKDFEKAANAAESVQWGELGLSVLTAYAGAIIGALSTKNPLGIAGGAAPGLVGAYRSIMKDIEDVPAANAAADAVKEAFKKLQECREDHKNEDGEDPFGDAPTLSPFDDGFLIIPFAEPDPDPEVSDDEIIIFDEEDIEATETEDGDIIIIEDE